MQRPLVNLGKSFYNLHSGGICPAMYNILGAAVAEQVPSELVPLVFHSAVRGGNLDMLPVPGMVQEWTTNVCLVVLCFSFLTVSKEPKNSDMKNMQTAAINVLAAPLS